MNKLFMGILLLSMVACANSTRPNQVLSPNISLGPFQAINITKGNTLFIHRQTWRPGFKVPVSFGSIISPTDTLQGMANPPGLDRVVCSETLLSLSVPSLAQALSCSTKTASISYRDSWISPLRGSGLPNQYPIILSPRKTEIKTKTPMLRWQKVDGATIYKVSIAGLSPSWTITTSATFLPYPDNAPTLVANVNYRLNIEANGFNSKDDTKQADIDFQVISPQKAKLYQDAELKIRQLTLDDDTTQFLIGVLYSSNNLHSEALDIFESLAKTSNEPMVWWYVGREYYQIGLPEEAEGWFLKALELAENKYPEQEAIAHDALGKVYAAIPNKNEAIIQYKQALLFYDEAGDEITKKNINNDINDIMNHP